MRCLTRLMISNWRRQKREESHNRRRINLDLILLTSFVMRFPFDYFSHGFRKE